MYNTLALLNTDLFNIKRTYVSNYGLFMCSFTLPICKQNNYKKNN